MATTAALIGGVILAQSAQPATAIGTAVDLGTASSYSVLGGQSVTNTGPSVLNRDLGVSPGTAISGFPPGVVLGAVHATDAQAGQAQIDLTTAYNSAAGQSSDASVAGDLGGRTLAAGVYAASSSIGLTGTVTLDAQGDPDAVFIFQVGSQLTTAPNSTVALLNGAQSCNVFWQIGSSATLDTDTTFVGTIMALASISANSGTTVEGRALARNGSVTLDDTTFTGADCDASPPVTSPPVTTPPVTTPPVTTPPVTSPPVTTPPVTTPPVTSPPVTTPPVTTPPVTTPPVTTPPVTSPPSANPSGSASSPAAPPSRKTPGLVHPRAGLPLAGY